MAGTTTTTGSPIGTTTTTCFNHTSTPEPSTTTSLPLACVSTREEYQNHFDTNKDATICPDTTVCLDRPIVIPTSSNVSTSCGGGICTISGACGSAPIGSRLFQTEQLMPDQDNGHSIEFLNVAFQDGRAMDGGAFFLSGGTARFYGPNCRFQGNRASADPESQANSGNGGAIYVRGSGTVWFKQCQFVENHADGKGGAVYVGTGTWGTEPATAHINDSIFNCNTAGLAEGEDIAVGGNYANTARAVCNQGTVFCNLSDQTLASVHGGQIVACGNYFNPKATCAALTDSHAA